MPFSFLSLQRFAGPSPLPGFAGWELPQWVPHTPPKMLQFPLPPKLRPPSLPIPQRDGLLSDPDSFHFPIIPQNSIRSHRSCQLPSFFSPNLFLPFEVPFAGVSLSRPSLAFLFSKFLCLQPGGRIHSNPALPLFPLRYSSLGGSHWPWGRKSKEVF